MRGLLVAAGYGTRLMPITETIPKCLVSIDGKPLLMYWFESLTSAGIYPILVNTHHHSSQVQAFISESQISSVVRVTHESKLLGTAGTIRENADFLIGESVFVAHADNYCLSNLKNLIAAHKARPAGIEITMLTFITEQPEQCGIVEVDENGLVTKFFEKVPGIVGNVANGAVYIISNVVVEDIRDHSDSVFDFSIDVLPRYLGRILAVPADNVHIDIGTHENLAKARKLSQI